MKQTIIDLIPRRSIWASLFASSLLAYPVLQAQDDADEEDIYELSPFTVDAGEDVGYLATSTLAGTRLRTNLKDVGSAISVFTEEFLQDTGSTNAEDLLVFAPSTEVSGQGGNFLGQGGDAVLDTTNRRAPVSNTRVRGLAEADNTRNYNLSDIPWDSYNVDRIDVQRGSNAILFGIGSPAGIVNASLKTAFFDDANEVAVQFGSYGSYRVTADINKVLIEDELAVRVAILNDKTDYRQDFSFRDDERVYFAGNWSPKALSSDSYNTEIVMSYENGRIRSNNPRQSPPLDAITPWFTDLNQQTWEGPTAGDHGNDWLGAPGRRVWDGVVTAFSPDQGITYVSNTFNTWPLSSEGTAVDGNNDIVGIQLYNQYATNASLEGSGISAYKAKSLTDSSIFDFYNILLEGPNKNEWNDFDAFNIALRQNFLNSKLGYELSWDKQEADWGYRNFMAGDAALITVDVMETLIDGTPNPNVGRPFTIASGGSAGGFFQEQSREVKRAQAYGVLDFTDSENETLGFILGSNTFTGLLSENSIDTFNGTFMNQWIGDSYAPNNMNSVGQASRDAIIYSYLGATLSGASSASGANLSGIQNVQSTQSTYVQSWNNEIQAYVSYPIEITSSLGTAREDTPHRNGSLGTNQIDSEVFVWQGSWFGDMFKPMVGWRSDKATSKNAGTPHTRGSANYPGATRNGLVDLYSDSWTIANNPDGDNTESGDSLTTSAVLHAPKSWKEKMGVGLSVHYAKSENFQPDASRTDLFGDTLASPTGETEEYGISFSAFDDKVWLKINKYETTVSNATAGGPIDGNYLIGAVEAWAQEGAIMAQNATGRFETIYGVSTSGGNLTYRPDRVLADDESYTQAEIDETYAVQTAAIDAWLGNTIPQAFQDTWALAGHENGNGQWSEPSTLAVTADTISEGTEIELIANPMPGLSISFNASKTEAQRQNLATSYVEWVESRWADFSTTPQGDVRLWSGDPDGDSGSETAEGKYSRETVAGLAFWQELEGSNVPELAKWRYNLIVNYAFQEGALSGTNVGGAFRHSDANTVGFPVYTDSEGEHYDISSPIKGLSEQHWDFWVGYEMAITDKIHWRIQGNVRNLFGGKDLYPVTVQPDGSPGTYRIGAPTTWTIKNTFTF